MIDIFADIKARRKSFVPPSGLDLADIIVLGESPLRESLLTKKPFASCEGQLVRMCIQAAKIPTSACYMTYVIKDSDMPLASYVKIPSNRRASPVWTAEGNEYIELLRKEILAKDASLIIAVGDIALCATTGRWGISKWRGSLLPCLFDPTKMVMPILPTGPILRGASENRHLIMLDLKKAMDLRNNQFKLTERKVIIKPSFQESLDYIDKCYVEGMNGAPIAFDIEIKHLELDCFSLAFSPFEAISIPLVCSNGDYFSPPQEAKILLKLASVLENRSIRILGQNLAFDTHFMLRKYGMRITNLDDSMIAHHTFLPQFPKGLDMITSIWTDIPYYKDEGKAWFKGSGTYENFWVYNGYDSLAVIDAFPKIYRELLLLDNTEAYERQLSIIEPCVYMQERGIKVDRASLNGERAVIEKEISIAKEELDTIVPNLNPQSPKQLQEYFYGKLKIKPYVNKQRKPTCDADALKRIARQKGTIGGKVASLISSIKKGQKLVSTYLADIKFDDDDRIRCSYNPCGTTFSRLSSSKSIFGTGTNMQNWPQRVLKHLRVDDGYIGYEMDLSQAENRIVAYVGRITAMINAFENGDDVHLLTSSLIFNKPINDILIAPESCPLGDGTHSERDWGKKANHGFNYDWGYKAFAMKNEMPEAEGKRIYNGYHDAYPELKRNFHGYIKTCLHKDRLITNLRGRHTLFLTDLIDSTFKAAYSCIPQGTVGDIINDCMGFLYYNDGIFGALELLKQTHDSINFQIPLATSWIEHARMVQSVKDKLEEPLTTHYGREFIIPVDTCMGFTLQKAQGLEIKASKWPDSLESLAQVMEKNYQTLLARGQ